MRVRGSVGVAVAAIAVMALAVVTSSASPAAWGAGGDAIDSPPEPGGGSRKGGPPRCTDADDREDGGRGRRARSRCGRSSGGAARADYNGDGRSDLAMGAPHRETGYVHVMYGSDDGLRSTAAQVLRGAAGTAEFGGALAGGDFNGDRFADLAVGAPGHNGGRGLVTIHRGSGAGVGPASQSFALTGQSGAQFGAALVWGDFDGDGFADLAVGAPGLTVDGRSGAGAVFVMYGSPQGLGTARLQSWNAGNLGPGALATEAGARFGSTLSAADAGRSVQHDLAIGAPRRTVGGVRGTGTVQVLYGAVSGLVTNNSQAWFYGQDGVTQQPRGDDLYGSALAMGDVTGDGLADLAVGAPGRLNVNERLGQVHLLTGSASGLTTARQGFFVLGAGEGDPAPRYGSALAIADFDGDRFADIAVGGPTAKVGSVARAGRVIVIYGTSDIPFGVTFQRWQQGVGGMFGAAQTDDGFGAALTAWNWGRGPQGDLAIGVPHEWVSGVPDAGAVNVLYGSASGLTTTGQQYVHQGRLGVGLAPARFGSSLY